MDVLAFMAASREAQQGACSSTLQCPAADSTPPKTRRVDLVEQAKPPISSAPVSAPRIDEPALSTDASRKVLPPPRRSGDLVAPPLQVPPSAWRAARVAPGWLPPTTAAMAAEGLGQCRADVVLVEANLWALATLNAVEAQVRADCVDPTSQSSILAAWRIDVTTILLFSPARDPGSADTALSRR